MDSGSADAPGDAVADGTPDRTDESVPRWVRPLLYGFLTVFVICGLFSIEVWPLTGWRLYHERRGEVRTSWQLVAVDGEGDEETIHLGELPLGWHNTTKLIGEFPAMTSAERDEVCRAWALPAASAGSTISEVRVYRVRSTLRAEPSDRRRELRWTCARR